MEHKPSTVREAPDSRIQATRERNTKRKNKKKGNLEKKQTKYQKKRNSKACRRRVFFHREREKKVTNKEIYTNYHIHRYICEKYKTFDNETYRHMINTAVYAKIIAEDYASRFPESRLGSREIEHIRLAAEIHDIGKMVVPASILKKENKLDESSEMPIVRAHVTAGEAMIAGTFPSPNDAFAQCCRNVCMLHHERWDGRGYPKGLKEEAIPIEAQIVAISDVLDALTSERVYKTAIDFEEAFSVICSGGCGAFSEKIYESFSACREQLFRSVETALKI